jgi:hypothetical protein
MVLLYTKFEINFMIWCIPFEFFIKKLEYDRTPNLINSSVIWQGLLDYGRLEWQETVKRQPDQEIKLLENFDRV